MVANQSRAEFHYLAGRYPGRIGWLLSPGAPNQIRGKRPFPWLPYALDNGAFIAFKNGEPFDADAFRSHLAWAAQQQQAPLWLAVPDVVGDADATLSAWSAWRDECASFGWPLAFVAQDGHDPDDVPADAALTFIGGSTEWKANAIRRFRAAGQRVHVGRVNAYERAMDCFELGVESIDGTGWYHDNPRQLRGIFRLCEEIEQGSRRQGSLAL